MVDLGAWATEQYRVGAEPEPQAQQGKGDEDV